MALTLEKYIESLALALRDASELRQWEIPMTHRTKDSVSAYKAAVGMVGAVMLKVLRESTGEPSASVVTPVQEKAEPASEPVDNLAEMPDTPIEDEEKPQNLFTDTEQPRRRRRETGNAA